MKKYASILDYSHPSLDPAVWDHELKLYAYQKDFVLRLLDKVYTTYNLKQPELWVEDIVIIGSLTTSKWLLTSDMDVHVRVNIQAFKDINMPQSTIQEAFTYLDETRKEFDRAKILAPMTQHPIEYYFESNDFFPSNVELVGVYSLMKDAWLKEPVIFPADLDYEESKKDVVAQAEVLAQTIDVSLGKVQRDIKRIDELEEVVKGWDREKQQLFYSKVEKKLLDIETELAKDVKIRQDLIDARHAEQDATSDTEVKFKWLARFGFFSILGNIKTLLEETGGKVTTQELPVIDNIINEGFLKEAFLKEAFEKETETDICVDLDKTIAKPAKFPKIGEPIEGAKEALEKLQSMGYNVIIYSCRADEEGGIDTIREYLDKHDLPYDSIFEGDKPFAKFYIDDRAIKFDSWDNVLKQVEKSQKKASLFVVAGIILPVIDPKSFKRKEPYALFFGTQWDSKHIVPMDLFNIYGEHALINEHNQLPTATLETLQKENIPIIGKEPRAGDKQPAQDISILFKQAKTKKIKQGDYSCLMALVPHDLAQEIVEFGVRTIPDDKLYQDEDGKLGRELESHITVKYGLTTNDAKDVRRSFNDEKPYHAKLGKVRHFEPPESPFDVVTVEIISEDLEKANKRITDNFECAEGLVSDVYHPHITIAYVKRGAAKDFIGSDDFEGKEIEIDTFIFSPHKGNRTYFSISHDKESNFIIEKITKIADFLPSLFNAPNNDWQFADGGPDKEIALNPDSVSDETTWYAPCTEGKPRTKEVWRQFMSIFKNPFSKKEDVTIEGSYNLISVGTMHQSHYPFLPEDMNIQVPENLMDVYINTIRNLERVEMDAPIEIYRKFDRERRYAHDAMITFVLSSMPQIEQLSDKNLRILQENIGTELNNFADQMMGGQKEATKKVSYDKELEQKEKDALGEDETLLDFQRGMYDPKKHDFPHNTTWDSLTQDGEPSKPTSVTYSPQISNEDNLDQNSPGGYPRRFMGKPKGEWFSNEGEVNNALIDMLKNREAAIDSLTDDITKIAITKQYAIYINNVAYPAARTLTRQKAVKILKERFPEAYANGTYKIVEEKFNTAFSKQAGEQSASVPDYLLDEWKTDQINNDTDEEPYVNHDQRDYPYGMHDSPENTDSGIGWAKDNQPYVVRLDILENPAYRLDPFGIGEYNVTWYESLPASDGIEATNPD